MAVVTKADYLERLNELLGDRVDDESLSVLEDFSDTYDDLSARIGEDWKERYEENDRMWREKYRKRFESGSETFATNTAENKTVVLEGQETVEDVTFDDIFKEV